MYQEYELATLTSIRVQLLNENNVETAYKTMSPILKQKLANHVLRGVCI